MRKETIITIAVIVLVAIFVWVILGITGCAPRPDYTSESSSSDKESSGLAKLVGLQQNGQIISVSDRQEDGFVVSDVIRIVDEKYGSVCYIYESNISCVYPH